MRKYIRELASTLPRIASRPRAGERRLFRHETQTEPFGDRRKFPAEVEPCAIGMEAGGSAHY